MKPFTPVTLIATASWTKATEKDPTGLKFLNRCGTCAHMDLSTGRTFWPLPLVDTCDALAHFSRARGVLEEDPIDGDVFLKYSALHRRFVRVGIVVSVDYEFTWDGRSLYVCTVIEAGVSRSLALSPVSGDRFIRWIALEEHRRAA